MLLHIIGTTTILIKNIDKLYRKCYNININYYYGELDFMGKISFDGKHFNLVRFRVHKRMTYNSAVRYAKKQLKDEAYKGCTIDTVYVNTILVMKDVRIT